MDQVRASILLVDDEYVIRKSLAKELRAENFSVTDVASGSEAIGALQRLQFNIVITDLMMEGIDGFGVLKAVKELTPLTRIIVITGYGDLRTAIDAMHLGADDFLVKPFEVEELNFRIRRCLEKRNLIEMLMEKSQQLEKEINRRGAMEERRQQDEKRMRLAMDAASNGVWDRNLQTGETYHGENWLNTLGYTPDEIPVFEDIIHPEDREKVLKLGDEHIHGKSAFFEAEFRLRNKAGEWQWVMSRGKVVDWDEQGRALRIVGTITDIDRLKRLENNLLRDQAALRKKVQEQAEELQEARLARQQVEKKANRAQQSVEIVDRLADVLSRLEDLPLSDEQRSMVAGLRADLGKFR